LPAAGGGGLFGAVSGNREPVPLRSGANPGPDRSDCPPFGEELEIMPRRPFLSSTLTFAIAALALTFGVAGLAGSASAQNAPKLLGKYDDWSAYTYGSGNDRMCYAMTT